MHVREILGFMTQAPARRNKSLKETIDSRRRLLIESRKRLSEIVLEPFFLEFYRFAPRDKLRRSVAIFQN